MPTRTVEDYIKRLYLAEQALTRISSGNAKVDTKPRKKTSGKSDSKAGLVMLSKLAQAMGVVPGTVTTMMRTLDEAGLVNYEPRSGCRLTDRGRKLALHVIRRHRLVELFLVRSLGLDWSEVHEEAEELEHAISERVLDRIDQHLGRPLFDPHGDPIPDRDGKLPKRAESSLLECEKGSRVKVSRIEHQDAQFLNFARDNGLIPGEVLMVVQANTTAGLVIVRGKGGIDIPLGTTAAGRVRVVKA